jgi:predicted unusual protein kinase regulating ubiquinone biosynthesis (AarF/ABC1/UbiB family)
VGVVSGLRQLLEFGLFHGDPHPGNIFCLRDGRIAYVDFGNVAQLSNSNKQVGSSGAAVERCMFGAV